METNWSDEQVIAYNCTGPNAYLLVKGTDYTISLCKLLCPTLHTEQKIIQEHVMEYGVHWNTLALLSVMQALLQPIFGQTTISAVRVVLAIHESLSIASGVLQTC